MAWRTGWLVIVFLAVVGLSDGIYIGVGLEPSPWVRLCYTAGCLWLLTSWIVADARERGLSLAMDQGLFLAVYWPVYIPVYLVRSRGWRGLALGLAVLFVNYAAFAKAFVAFRITIMVTG